MPRQHRFGYKLQCWVPEEHAEAVERLAREQLLDVSAVLRMAIVLYLRNYGIVPQPPRQEGRAAEPSHLTNGQQHREHHHVQS